MRNLKKFLALVMAMVMAFSLMLSASAANPVKTFDDADQITEAFVEAADVLTGMKVFQGDERGFAPGATITRAETAALIYRLATGDTGDTRKDLYKDYGNFADVNSGDWFAGYVGYCANAGYIKGHNGYFNPYGQVTGYEALAMILRAVGYDKNHEFEGATWQTNVSALATQLGILKQVKSTHYGDRLYEPSRRDVVASLLFESAQIPMVNYTQIGGYNKFQNLIDNTLNDSLGYKNFGLKNVTRIVLGNQETGENCTLLGNEAGSKKYTNPSGNEYTATWNEYTYPGSPLAVNENGTTYAAMENTGVVTAPAGIKLDVKTGLDLYGHKVKFWFNDKDTGNKTTYAYFDKASLAKTVYSESTTGNGTHKAGNSLATNGNLLEAAKEAGFSKNNGAVWSDAYSRFDSYKIITANVDASMAVNAGWDDDGTNTAGLSQVNMYTLVSNSDNKGVDVVIRENIELAKITKLDTTSKDKTLTLGNANAHVNTSDSKGFWNNVTPRTTNNGEILLDNLTEGSVQTLGSIVYATEIRGTNGVSIYTNTTPATYAAGLQISTVTATTTEDNLYKLEKPETVETTVNAGTPNVDTQPAADGNVKTIILGDGTTLKRSGISRGVDSTDTAVTVASDGRVISGAVKVFHYDSTTGMNVAYGETYTVYKDKIGRFIGFTQGTDRTFLYGTFADYEFGGLGTGALQYAITGVDWDGNIVKNHVLTTIYDRDLAGTGATPYGALGAAADTLATAYTDAGDSMYTLEIAKKHLGTNYPDVGNQIKAGYYTGYVINPAGTLWNAPTDRDKDLTVTHADRMDSRTYARVINTNAGDTNDWTVTATDASYGFKTVNDGTREVMLTNNTKFIVVSGTGTDTLDVKVYNGLTEFLGDSNEVTFDIDKGTAGSADDHKAYYKTKADTYNNVSTTDNNQVDTVILPASHLIGKKLDTLYFLNNLTPTGIRLGTYDQYVMYNNGEAGYYFINNFVNDDGTSTTTTTEKGFYTLEAAKTVNGTTVYNAVDVDTATGTRTGVGPYDIVKGICREDVAYSYISTSNLYTGTLNDLVGTGTATTAPNKTHAATTSPEETFSAGIKTYRVDSAKVIDLTNGLASDGVTKHNGFNSIADINAAISRGWTNVRVSIVNTDVNVNLVYVTSATAPAIS